ncbi:hypothetical protein D3C85_1920980 [compost metagenome]
MPSSTCSSRPERDSTTVKTAPAAGVAANCSQCTRLSSMPAFFAPSITASISGLGPQT